MEKLGKFAARAQKELGVRSGAVTVCLVSDSEMARWNLRYRGKKGPTDVLSFPAETARETHGRNANRAEWTHRARTLASMEQYLGDIAIAPTVAKRNARRFGRTFERELRILVLHGLLHLLGYDHETDTGQMDRRERRLRRSLGLD